MMSCVLCLESSASSSEQYIKINSEEGEQLDVKHIIGKYFWMNEDDLKSATCKICKQCWSSVYNFHQFYLRVQFAHNVLDKQPILPEIVLADVAEDALVNETLKVTLLNDENKLQNIKYEENSIDVASLEEVTKKVKRKRGRPKRQKSPTVESNVPASAPLAETELVELPNLENVKDEIEQLEFMEIDIDVPTIEENKSIECNIVEPSAIKKTRRRTKATKENKSKKQTHSHRTIKTRDYDEFIANNFKLTCCICESPLENFTELKRHFRTEHNTRGYVLCCRKKLLKRGVLVDHLHTHQNPNYFTCSKCSKVLADRRSLELHIRNHEDPHERVFRCEVCSKSFYRRSIYTRHVLLHLPEDQKTVKCTECEKCFATKYHMNQHLRMVHLRLDAKICDVCGKLIRGCEALKRHQEEHAGIATSAIQCELCGGVFRNKYGLNYHIKMMHTAENMQKKTCPICSKVSSNAHSLKRHILFMHNMERKHACTLCDKAFKRNTDLREHMTTHTGEVLYTCPHCPKTFNSNANLHSHRKKAHREEWEEARRQRYRLKPVDDSNQEPAIALKIEIENNHPLQSY